jgi:TPP-dependent pyruvate/acetoin dehydrogenase alpha subunit
MTDPARKQQAEEVDVDLDSDFYCKLLKRMMLIRAVEERIASRYVEQEMRCPTHLSIGQEAVAAAVGLLLRTEDQAVSTHRAHAHYIGKGGNVRAMIAEIYGKASGCSAGKGGSMHLIDLSVGFVGSTAIVGNTIPVGVGVGLANKLKQNGLVSCVFLGDAAVEEGVFHEAANFAVLHNLPVLFVCENNLYSVYSPLDVRQPKGRNIHEQAASYGMKAFQADGNHPEEICDALIPAIQGVRGGEGPCFAEFSTYRWREHCGPKYDNDLGYRTISEYEEWRERDPIPRLVQQLKEGETFSDLDFERIEREVDSVVDDAFEHAVKSAFPDRSEAYTHVYAGE